MSSRKNTVATLLTVVGVVAIAALPTLAQAASITLTFTCQVLSSTTTPDVCVEGGSGPGANANFGTLTLTDSAIDTNRVDITWAMTPQWGTNIERVLLNYNGTVPANHTLYLVDQAAAAGSTTNITGTTHLIGNQPIGTTYQFDIRVNEASPQGLTFSGSLGLRSAISPFAWVDLSVNSFLATSNLLNGATPPLYAFYSTSQPGTVQAGWTISNGTEFWGGVSSAIVPVPAAVWLLGSALGVLGVIRRMINS
jgi:hypothetical protein